MPQHTDKSSMYIWEGFGSHFTSDKVGPEQTFRLSNLGHGNVALQVTAGPDHGKYLSGYSGGWYPQEFGLGDGSVNTSDSPVAFHVGGGDLLAILVITNSGYALDLSNTDLGALSLNNADMRQCNLTRAGLSQVPGWAGAKFEGATLRHANLAGRHLAGADWTKADFTGTNLSDIDAIGAHMPGAIFDGAILTGRKFTGAHLAGATFKGATLDHADFTDADLTGADFTHATLVGCVFTGAILLGTHFDNVNLSGVAFSPSPNFTRAATNRTTFSGSTVPFGALSSNWSWLDLTGATITGIPAAIPSLVADGALLPSGLDLHGIDLSGASLVGTRMYEVQLQGANLQGAKLRGALMKGAKLVGTNLTSANLDSAFLIAEDTATLVGATPKRESAVATGAFLVNANLDGAHCDGVDFSGALFLTSAFLGNQPASAQGAFLNLAKFPGAKLALANFSNAQLSAADFYEASLVGATLKGVQLTPSSDPTHTPASLNQADIRGADFTGANMDGLDMRQATYSTAKGPFEQTYDGYKGQKILVGFEYGPTVLGDTTSGTTCPNGQMGPCHLPE
ncbi:MAG: pentapeptide repeat-containing protein [Azospirillaceae bacterium]|nr:pentapeptide repeat-containing protein [Azospirillaceae bacterium]